MIIARNIHHIRLRLVVRLGRHFLFHNGFWRFFTRNRSVERAEHTHVHLRFIHSLFRFFESGRHAVVVGHNLGRLHHFFLDGFCDEARFVLLFEVCFRLEFGLCIHLAETLYLLLLQSIEITLEIDRFVRFLCDVFDGCALLRRLCVLQRLVLHGSVSRHKVFADRALRGVYAEFVFEFVSAHRAIRRRYAGKCVSRIAYAVKSCKIVLART